MLALAGRRADTSRAVASRLRVAAAMVAVTLVSACSGSSDDGAGERPAPNDAASITSPTIHRKPPEARSPFRSGCDLPVEYLQRIRRGVYTGRSPEITIVPQEPNFFGSFSGTTHSGPWDYLQEVPIVFYGPGFIESQGEVDLDREVTVADIAPTLAELLGVPFPEERPGRALTEVLVPEEERPAPPRMILNIVWDGGGWNVLDATKGAWPFLERLMQQGSSVRGIVGSSPSVTPAIHTSIGTGTFPSEHGIVSIRQRSEGEMVEAFGGTNPQYLEVEALGDIYDRATQNAAKVGMFAEKNWMLGMIGHGAYLEGADNDVAIMLDAEGGLISNSEWYSLPEYLHDVPGFEADVRRVDLEDGELDQAWYGMEALDARDEMLKTPVWILYQTRLLEALFDGEGYGDDAIADLFYVNYKQMDHLGHLFNMLGPEVERATRYADAAMQDLVEYLDREVGRGRWVLTMTADHGQSPDPRTVGAWPIDSSEVPRDIAAHFGVDVDDLIEEQRPNGYWVDKDTMAANGITLRDISEFLLDYTLEDNIAEGREVPDEYDARMGERLFAAAFARTALDEIWRCATRKP